MPIETRIWSDIWCSTNGQKVIAVEGAGIHGQKESGPVISTDSGATFAQTGLYTDPDNLEFFTCVAASDDLSAVILGVDMETPRVDMGMAIGTVDEGWFPVGGEGSAFDPFVAGSGTIVCAAISANTSQESGGFAFMVGNARLYLWTDWSETPFEEIYPPQAVGLYYEDVACDSDGSVIVTVEYGGRVRFSTDSGETFTDPEITGDTDEDWVGCCCDADGSVMVVTINGGRVYRSTNSGLSFAEIRPAGNVDGDWWGCCCDADGSVIVVTENGGRIYASYNDGASWAEEQPGGDSDYDWAKVCCSSTGDVIFAVIFDGRIWKRSGGSWSEIRPDGDRDGLWAGIDCSSTGVVVVACELEGRIWKSTDSGATWAELRPHGKDADQDWGFCKCDSDGSVIIAGIGYPGWPVYQSIDSGSSWTVLSPPVFDFGLFGAAIDADGSHIILAPFLNSLHISADAGSSWEVPDLFDASDRNWSCCDMDPTGQYILACENPGRVFLSNTYGRTWVELWPTHGTDDLAVVSCSIGETPLGYKKFVICTSDGVVYSVDERGEPFDREVIDAELTLQGVSAHAGNSIIVGGTENIRFSGDNGQYWYIAEDGTPTAEIDRNFVACCSGKSGTTIRFYGAANFNSEYDLIHAGVAIESGEIMAGENYAEDDILWVSPDGDFSPAVGEVTNVTEYGVVLSMSITNAGGAYATGVHQTEVLTSATGTSTGLTINITGVDGNGAITAASVSNGGTGWSIGDTFYIKSDVPTAKLQVTAVDDEDGIATVSILESDGGFSDGTYSPFTVTGSGSGATLYCWARRTEDYIYRFDVDLQADYCGLWALTNEKDSLRDIERKGGAIVSATLNQAGTGYAADEVVYVNSESAGATVKILTVDTGGEVLTFEVQAPGAKYRVATDVGTFYDPESPGGGSGFTLDITEISMQSFVGAYWSSYDVQTIVLSECVAGWITGSGGINVTDYLNEDVYLKIIMDPDVGEYGYMVMEAYADAQYQTRIGATGVVLSQALDYQYLNWGVAYEDNDPDNENINKSWNGTIGSLTTVDVTDDTSIAIKLDQDWQDMAVVINGSEVKSKRQRFISLDADGFTVGDASLDDHPNRSGMVYSFIVWW